MTKDPSLPPYVDSGEMIIDLELIRASQTEEYLLLSISSVKRKRHFRTGPQFVVQFHQMGAQLAWVFEAIPI